MSYATLLQYTLYLILQCRRLFSLRYVDVDLSLLVSADSIYHQHNKVLLPLHVHLWETVRTEGGTGHDNQSDVAKSTAVNVIQFRLYEASRGHIEAK